MKKILLGVALTLVTGTLIAANVPGFVPTTAFSSGG